MDGKQQNTTKTDDIAQDPASDKPKNVSLKAWEVTFIGSIYNLCSLVRLSWADPQGGHGVWTHSEKSQKYRVS